MKVYELAILPLARLVNATICNTCHTFTGTSAAGASARKDLGA